MGLIAGFAIVSGVVLLYGAFRLTSMKDEVTDTVRGPRRRARRWWPADSVKLRKEDAMRRTIKLTPKLIAERAERVRKSMNARYWLA